MAKHLSVSQIEAACSHLLQQTRRVSVRDVTHYLRAEYGTAGRNERVAAILKRLQESAGPFIPPESIDFELQQLRQELAKAEERARNSEEMERAHQHFWANRYAEKVAELEARARALPSSAKPSEQYLRLYQRAAELARRLSQYEEVGPLTGYGSASIPE